VTRCRHVVPHTFSVAAPCVPYMTILMLPVPMVVKAPMKDSRSAALALYGTTDKESTGARWGIHRGLDRAQEAPWRYKGWAPWSALGTAM
jgi:hypothetical protein